MILSLYLLVETNIHHEKKHLELAYKRLVEHGAMKNTTDQREISKCLPHPPCQRGKRRYEFVNLHIGMADTISALP